MGTFLSYSKAIEGHFTISYPHYGLFRTADVTLLQNEEDPLFECRLLNGPVILLKKIAQSRQWVDAQLNQQTSLAYIIGMYIDDILRERQ